MDGKPVWCLDIWKIYLSSYGGVVVVVCVSLCAYVCALPISPLHHPKINAGHPKINSQELCLSLLILFLFFQPFQKWCLVNDEGYLYKRGRKTKYKIWSLSLERCWLCFVTVTGYLIEITQWRKDWFFFTPSFRGYSPWSAGSVASGSLGRQGTAKECGGSEPTHLTIAGKQRKGCGIWDVIHPFRTWPPFSSYTSPARNDVTLCTHQWLIL